MTMEYNQWERILRAVNADKDLSKDNVIEKIKGNCHKIQMNIKRGVKLVSI